MHMQQQVRTMQVSRQRSKTVRTKKSYLQQRYQTWKPRTRHLGWAKEAACLLIHKRNKHTAKNIVNRTRLPRCNFLGTSLTKL